MEEQKVLTEEQDIILRVLDNESELRSILNEDKDWIYQEALEKYAYDEDKLDKILNILKHLGYVDSNNKITAEGSYYLQQVSLSKSQKYKKGNKENKVENIIKLVTAVVALLTAIITITITICNALNK